MNVHQLCMVHAYYRLKLVRFPDRMSPVPEFQNWLCRHDLIVSTNCWNEVASSVQVGLLYYLSNIIYTNGVVLIAMCIV